MSIYKAQPPLVVFFQKKMMNKKDKRNALIIGSSFIILSLCGLLLSYFGSASREAAFRNAGQFNAQPHAHHQTFAQAHDQARPPVVYEISAKLKAATALIEKAMDGSTYKLSEDDKLTFDNQDKIYEAIEALKDSSVDIGKARIGLCEIIMLAIEKQMPEVASKLIGFSPVSCAEYKYTGGRQIIAEALRRDYISLAKELTAKSDYTQRCEKSHGLKTSDAEFKIGVNLGIKIKSDL